MTRYGRRLLLLLGTALLTVGAAVYWSQTRPTGRSGAVHSPKGMRARLQHVTRLPNGDVDLLFTVKNMRTDARRVSLEAGELLANGRETQPHLWWPSYSSAANKLTIHAQVSVPTKADKMAIAQEIRIRRPGRALNFTFRSLAAGVCPVTQRQSDVDVTVERIYVNQIVDPKPGEKLSYVGPHQTGYKVGKPHFAAHVSIHAASRGLIPPDAVHLTTAGRIFDLLAEYDCFGHQLNDQCQAAFDEGGHQTVPEEVVGVFSPRVSNKMKDKRVSNAVDRAFKKSFETQHIIYACNPIYPPPRRFNLQVSVDPPPDPKDTMWVVFRDVPITK